MKINVQSVNFNADQKLINFIERKLEKLENHFDKIVHADVYLKVQSTGEPENKISEIMLSIPGDSLMVKRTSNTFEKGIDEGTSAMRRKLLKRKEKLSAYA